MMENVRLIPFAVLGMIFIIRDVIIPVLGWIWGTFLRRPKDLKKYGSWAVVTGPTDGIGKALSFRLAEHGLNLVLVGRNPSKLNEVSSEICGKYCSVDVRIVVADFSGDMDDGVKRIEEGVDGLDVGLLVNNVGIMDPYPMYFHESEFGFMEDLVRVNAMGATRVTHAILKKCMLKKKKGAIVNIGSGSSVALPSFPLHSVYAASKGYLLLLSRTLYTEYRKHGIDVQCQVPHFVATKLVNMKSSFFVPTPEEYARWSLRWIGYEPICTPYWKHFLCAWGRRFALDVVLDWWFLTHQVVKRKEYQVRDAFDEYMV